MQREPRRRRAGEREQDGGRQELAAEDAGEFWERQPARGHHEAGLIEVEIVDHLAERRAGECRSIGDRERDRCPEGHQPATASIWR